MNHAAKLFPIALQELIEIGEKGMKQREQGERAKLDFIAMAARPKDALQLIQDVQNREGITL